jgi:2-amino-4-hydroxy-6-hydroxymethyldihydropteridine diphosphokinase
MPREPVFIAFGSNLGDRQANLRTAIDLLPNSVEILKGSSIYETPPWGYADQPSFLNQVIEVSTTLRPVCLLRKLKHIERKIGRKKTFRYGPRLIDLDILFYGERVIHRRKLQIPHPRLHERAFVLVPLAEIAPNFVHPVLNQTVQTLLSRVDATGVTRL